MKTFCYHFSVMCHVCLHPSFHNITEYSSTELSVFLFPLFKVTHKLCLSVILSQLCILSLAFSYFIFFSLFQCFVLLIFFVSPVHCVFTNHCISLLALTSAFNNSQESQKFVSAVTDVPAYAVPFF